VENQDRNTELYLYGSDVLHLLGEFVGVIESSHSTSRIKVYPNPFKDKIIG